MIVIEDEGKPPIAWKRYDWARGKRRFFESAYDFGCTICENVYPGEEYHCQVGENEWEVFGLWGKAWWGMRQMRKDWGELSHPDKIFLTWGLVRATSVEDLRCCAQHHFGVHRDYPYMCYHDTLRENDKDIEIPKQYDCGLYNPNSCRVHESFIPASVFFDVAGADEIKKREEDAASKETAPPPAKTTRVQETKKGARPPFAPFAGLYKNKNNKKVYRSMCGLQLLVGVCLLTFFLFQKNKVMGGQLCSEANMFQKDMGLRLCSIGDSTERRYQKTTMFFITLDCFMEI